MVLQQRYPGLTEEHPHVKSWDTLDELVDMCRSELRFPNYCIERGKIQAQHVQDNCRWSNRVAELETLIAKYR